MSIRRPAPQALSFNGVDGATGALAWPEVTERELAAALARRVIDLDRLAETGKPFTPFPLGRLDAAGWGVIFHRDADPAVRAALAPLLAWRRQQAAKRKPRLFRDFAGECGVWPRETAYEFLERHGVGPASGDPETMPYYLLLVGGPEEIPFAFQYQLAGGHAVGRLACDRLEDYARYAASVVRAEREGCGRRRQLSVVAPRHRDDEATRCGEENLVAPFCERFSQRFDRSRSRQAWKLDVASGARATKRELIGRLAAADGPALMLTVSHGLTFSSGHPLQPKMQGALITSEWPGALDWPRALPPEFYVAAADLGEEACLHGLVSFHFACFSGGTPELDNFSRDRRRKPPRLAPEPFVAALPKRMLTHPNGGALAVIGHVDSAWAHSFLWRRLKQQSQAFEHCFEALIAGQPVGAAMEAFSARLDAIVREQMSLTLRHDAREAAARRLDASWHAAVTDLRNYVVLGDPAVRVAC